VRPLISTGDPKKSVDISRKAELYETSSGMITITGGKLTTWRRMAKLAVDRIVEREGRDAPCRTHEIPLGLAVDAAELPRVEGVPEDAYAQLAGRYGYAARDVLALAADRGELAQPVLPGRPDLLAEAVHAARREQARTVGDVLLRRTRLGVTAARALCAPGEQAPERVAAALGEELGWDRARRAAEAAEFRAEAEAEGIVVAP
jgi:glycerol-3-phosphate dehydrogenase